MTAIEWSLSLGPLGGLHARHFAAISPFMIASALLPSDWIIGAFFLFFLAIASFPSGPARLLVRLDHLSRGRVRSGEQPALGWFEFGPAPLPPTVKEARQGAVGIGVIGAASVVLIKLVAEVLVAVEQAHVLRAIVAALFRFAVTLLNNSAAA